MPTTALDPIRVHTLCRLLNHRIPILVVDVFQIERVNMTGEIADRLLVLLDIYGRKTTNPKIVKSKLIRKSTLQPEMRKTPSGGTD